MTIKNSNFINNTATYGGAIYNYGGSLNLGRITIVNCNFINNTASGSGGSIMNNLYLPLNGTGVINCTFTNNHAGTGGAIITGGNFNIINSIFKNNQASWGGAIATEMNMYIVKSTFIANKGINGVAILNNGNLFITSSNFYFNKASGGGAIYNYKGYNSKAGTIKIISTNFKNNNANQGAALFNYEGIINATNSNFITNNANYGGAIYNLGTFHINFNRIIGNTAKISGNAIVNVRIYEENGTTGIADGKFNWWGSNINPSNNVVVDVNVTPWLVLKLTADPNVIKYGGKSFITTDLLHDSNGVYHNPESSYVPDGIFVKFASDKIGILTSLVGKMNNGAASTIFKANYPGNSLITSFVDDFPITTKVKIYTAVPIVMGSSPKNNTVNVALNKVLRITYNKAIKFTKNTHIEIKNFNGSTYAFRLTIFGSTLVIIPKSLLTRSAHYTVIIHSNSITDLIGKTISPPYLIRFNTTKN